MLQNTSLTMCPVHPSYTSTVLPNFTWRRHIMGTERQALSSPYPPTHPHYHRPTHPPHYLSHTRHTLLHITLLPHTHLLSSRTPVPARPIVSETHAKRDQTLHRAFPRTRVSGWYRRVVVRRSARLRLVLRRCDSRLGHIVKETTRMEKKRELLSSHVLNAHT